MSKKKKIIVLSCMIALLAVTAVFNFVMTNESIAPTEVVSANSSSYFAQYRAERLSTRNEELLQLDNVIKNSIDGSEEKNQALSMKVDLTANTEKEMLLENLIKAYGFEDAVVVIGLESDNVNVITKSANLSLEDSILIYTIVSEETDISPENVKIIPIS